MISAPFVRPAILNELKINDQLIEILGERQYCGAPIVVLVGSTHFQLQVKFVTIIIIHHTIFMARIKKRKVALNALAAFTHSCHTVVAFWI